MYIYESKLLSVSEDDEFTEENLLFTPENTPKVGNLVVSDSADKQDEYYDNLPDGYSVYGYFESGAQVEVGSYNTHAGSELQLIELPSVDLNTVIYVHSLMTVGDTPIIMYDTPKEILDKIQYEYEEGGER